MSLLFLGAFLLVGGLMARFWAADQVKRTPLDVSSVTRLAGEAQLYDGTALETHRVKATSTTHADSEKSDDDVVVFQNSSCLVLDPDGTVPDCVSADDPDERLVSAGTDHFATDRRTALAVNEARYLPPDAKEHEGLVNKFPFDVERRDYPFWDSLANQSVTAAYAGEETLDGLTTYRFDILVQDAAIEIGDDPGVYATEKRMWVDPATGSIIKQTERQVRKMQQTGQTVLDLTFGFTPETVEANVADAKENAARIDLLTQTVPIVGVLGGVAAIAGGLVLMPRRRDAHQPA
jgi:hypothetical protein